MELSMSVSESGIRSDFLNPTNYKTTLDFASKRNENYLKFCKVIQKYYSDMHAVTRVVAEKVRVQPGVGLLSINQTKQFLLDFMGIMEEVSKFKMGFYQQLEEVEEDPVKKPTYDILASIERYSMDQNNYRDLYKKLSTVEKQLEEAYLLLKKQTKDPLNYFDAKNTIAKCNQIDELIKNREELQKEGNQLLESIYKNSELFEKDIMFYRQKMLCAKYRVHEKIKEMTRGAKECLVQTFLTLLDLVNERKRGFQQSTKESMKESTLFQKFQKNLRATQSTEEMKLTQIIIQATQEYKMLIDDLSDLLKTLVDVFEMLSLSTKDNNELCRPVIEELNKLYQNQENPTPDLIQTLDLFNFFCQKLGDIPNRIHILQSNLVKLKQNISKHSQITLSLVRCGNLNKSQHVNKGLDQIGHLFEQLSYDFLNDTINKLYKEFEGTLGNMKNYFNSKFYKQKKKIVEDSMEVSHIQCFQPLVEKRPSKKEMWIWKDFKNSEKYHKLSTEPKILFDVIKEVKNFRDLKGQRGKEIEKYNCSVKSKKQLRGMLCINEKVLSFAAANNSIDVTIPYEFIEEVVAAVNIFEKELTIKTSVGQIIFLHFPQISRAEVLIQQQMEAQSSKQVTVQKISAELSAEEKGFLAERKAKIEGERVPIDDMVKKGSVALENVTIDAVYDVIYSDKPFKFKGKEECCFMVHPLKKNGGSNYTITPYKPIGPHFYSGQEGNTFVNTPLISQRTNQYEVALPPIPFMPKTCQTTQKVKIYWLSNQQFDYTMRIDSRGAPMADSFYITMVHRVVQKDKNVEINIYYKLTFVSEPALKGTLISKSEEQSNINVGLFIADAKKAMKAGGGGGSKNEKNEDQPGKMKMIDQDDARSQQNESMSKNKVIKLQSQNKVLIGILIAVILINIIWKFF